MDKKKIFFVIASFFGGLIFAIICGHLVLIILRFYSPTHSNMLSFIGLIPLFFLATIIARLLFRKNESFINGFKLGLAIIIMFAFSLSGDVYVKRGLMGRLDPPPYYTTMDSIKGQAQTSNPLPMNSEQKK